jgi:hypothetical protein
MTPELKAKELFDKHFDFVEASVSRCQPSLCVLDR